MLVCKQCTLKLPPQLSGVLCVVHVSDCFKSVLAVVCLFVCSTCFQQNLSTLYSLTGLSTMVAGRQLEEGYLFWLDVFQNPPKTSTFHSGPSHLGIVHITYQCCFSYPLSLVCHNSTCDSRCSGCNLCCGHHNLVILITKSGYHNECHVEIRLLLSPFHLKVGPCQNICGHSALYVQHKNCCYIHSENERMEAVSVLLQKSGSHFLVLSMQQTITPFDFQLKLELFKEGLEV